MKRKKYSKDLKTKVALAALKGHQTVNEIASEFGVHVSQVNRWKKEALESLPSVFGNTRAKKEKEAEKEREFLYRQIGKLQVELDWLKKKFRAPAMSVAEKKELIKPDHPRLSVKRQCELIGLPCSSYYRKTINGQESAKNLEIMRLIDEEYTKHPFYSTRKMRLFLQRQGYNVNRKRLQRLMRKLGFSRLHRSQTPVSQGLNTRFIPIFFGIWKYRSPIRFGVRMLTFE